MQATKRLKLLQEQKKQKQVVQCEKIKSNYAVEFMMAHNPYFLTCQFLIAHATRVCKAWNFVISINYPKIFQQVYFTGQESIECMETLLIKSFPFLSSLDWTNVVYTNRVESFIYNQRFSSYPPNLAVISCRRRAFNYFNVHFLSRLSSINVLGYTYLDFMSIMGVNDHSSDTIIYNFLRSEYRGKLNGINRDGVGTCMSGNTSGEIDRDIFKCAKVECNNLLCKACKNCQLSAVICRYEFSDNCDSSRFCSLKCAPIFGLKAKKYKDYICDSCWNMPRYVKF